MNIIQGLSDLEKGLEEIRAATQDLEVTLCNLKEKLVPFLGYEQAMTCKVEELINSEVAGNLSKNALRIWGIQRMLNTLLDQLDYEHI